MESAPHWASLAKCRFTESDELFVDGAAQTRAKRLCDECPVLAECLAEALDNNLQWGIWGGMTERERRALLRRRPDVTSWRKLLETARKNYDRHPDGTRLATTGHASTASR
jgi:WhiB family redox-sensing transcriptional regulator